MDTKVFYVSTQNRKPMADVIINRIAPKNLKLQETSKPESRRARRLSIIREFALNTSAHGLPGIARSKSKHNCIFWTISFLAFTGVMIYFVTTSIENYFQYPTKSSVTVAVQQGQIFPAVTFCNYVPGRFDRLIGPFLNYTNAIGATNTNDTSSITAQQAYLIYDFLQSQINTGQDIETFLFTIDTLLMGCTYNGQTCTKDDFISFLSSSYGQCFTFNAKRKTNGTVLRSTNDNGGPGRLVLRLYAQSQLYIPYITEDVTVGMVAMVHENTQIPLIDVASIFLATGRRHKLGYKKKTYEFLSSPYTNCTTKIPSPMQSMFDTYGDADYAYSQGVCYKLCTQAYLYDQCGCVSPYEWTARAINLRANNSVIMAPLCRLNNTCYSAASTRISKTTSISDQYCADCYQECSTTNFVVTTSSVDAPYSSYVNYSKAFLETLAVPLPANWSTNWMNEVQNNYISLEVVCESSQVESYTEQPSVSPVDLLSSVGGQTGLWIGISFLSVMELIEMLYRLLRYELFLILRRLRNKFNRNIG